MKKLLINLTLQLTGLVWPLVTNAQANTTQHPVADNEYSDGQHGGVLDKSGYRDAFNITKAPASEERYPVWSPDGKQVVFTSNRAGTYNLYIANADGSQVRQLTNQPPPAVFYFPSWTADGRQIWFSLADDPKGKAVIGYVTPDGKPIKK